MTRMSEIPPALLAEMTPSVRAFVESLMLQMAEMQARMQAEIDDLKAQVKSSPRRIPPSRLRLSIRMQVMFRIWHRYQSGEIKWTTFQARMKPVRTTGNHLLLRGMCSGNTRLKGM